MFETYFSIKNQYIKDNIRLTFLEFLVNIYLYQKNKIEGLPKVRLDG